MLSDSGSQEMVTDCKYILVPLKMIRINFYKKKTELHINKPPNYKDI